MSRCVDKNVYRFECICDLCYLYCKLGRLSIIRFVISISAPTDNLFTVNNLPVYNHKQRLIFGDEQNAFRVYLACSGYRNKLARVAQPYILIHFHSIFTTKKHHSYTRVSSLQPSSELLSIATKRAQ